MEQNKEHGMPDSHAAAQRKSEKEGRPEIPQHELPAHAPNEQVVRAVEELDLDEG